MGLSGQKIRNMADSNPGKVKAIMINRQEWKVRPSYIGHSMSSDNIAQPIAGASVIDTPVPQLHQAITVGRFFIVLNSPKYGYIPPDAAEIL